MTVRETTVKNILTRTTGFLRTVTSHSVQPYGGCTYGNSLCGVGCYVQHNFWLTKGRPWGTFLEVRTNAALSYRANLERERRYGRNRSGRFGIFMSSSTDPFVPQEARFGVTKSLLEAMGDDPPDLLILQTHSHRVRYHQDALMAIPDPCELRVHISIETDRESIPGLPPHASSIEARFEAARALKEAGLFVVVTVSPLLPIVDPERFFGRVAESANAVVVDHYVKGDGSQDGRRTMQTPLPEAIRVLHPEAQDLGYRDEMVEAAQEAMPGRVGVHIDGFAGRYIGPTHSENSISD